MATRLIGLSRRPAGSLLVSVACYYDDTNNNTASIYNHDSGDGKGDDRVVKDLASWAERLALDGRRIMASGSDSIEEAANISSLIYQLLRFALVGPTLSCALPR